MKTAVSVIVRILLLAAIWSAWGPLPSIIAFLVLALVGLPETYSGKINWSSNKVLVRMIAEIAGLVAVFIVWGIGWAFALLILYVFGMAI